MFLSIGMESYIHRCVKKVGRLTAVGHHPFQVPHSGAKTGWRKKVRWQASLDRLPEILLGHQGKSHLSLIFLSRADIVLEVVSALQERPGDTLPICQFLIYTQLSLALERPVPSGQRTLPGKLTAKHSSHFLISTWTLENDLKYAYL